MKLLCYGADTAATNRLRVSLQKKKYLIFFTDYEETAIDEAASGVYDVLIVCDEPPQYCAAALLRKIRAGELRLPVLVLTGDPSAHGRCRILDCGADDCLSMPCSREEILSRLRAVSRREGIFPGDSLSFRELHLQLSSFLLTSGDASERLSRKEFEILRCMFLHGDTVVRKEELLLRLWGYENPSVNSNHLEAHISHIRKKLESLHSSVTIRSMRGVGYYFSNRSSVSQEILQKYAN